MSLLQNLTSNIISSNGFDYQSECHCSKTDLDGGTQGEEFDYQSECHCSKTVLGHGLQHLAFDYQSECHCSKTTRSESE